MKGVVTDQQPVTFGGRTVKVVYPENFEEYQHALSMGYQVATTDAQRAGASTRGPTSRS